jgi:hypothetical protein
MRHKKSNKFGAVKTVIDGFIFDSKKEAQHYLVLKARLSRCEIFDLQRQVVYELKGINGTIVCRLIPDFQYKENGRLVIDEVKSKVTITPIYRLKKKLFIDNFPHILYREIL